MDKEVISALRWLAKETEFVFAKEQLEDAANRLDALLAELERLNAENEAMQSIARHAEELDEQLAAVTAERDAAVRHLKAYEDLGTVEELAALKEAAERIVLMWDNCYIEPYSADVKDYIERMRKAIKEADHE